MNEQRAQQPNVTSELDLCWSWGRRGRVFLQTKPVHGCELPLIFLKKSPSKKRSYWNCTVKKEYVYGIQAFQQEHGIPDKLQLP